MEVFRYKNKVKNLTLLKKKQKETPPTERRKAHAHVPHRRRRARRLQAARRAVRRYTELGDTPPPGRKGADRERTRSSATRDRPPETIVLHRARADAPAGLRAVPPGYARG